LEKIRISSSLCRTPRRPWFFTSDSEYLQIINLAKLRNITLDQQYDLQEHTQDLERDKLTIIANELARYKKEYALVDF